MPAQRQGSFGLHVAGDRVFSLSRVPLRTIGVNGAVTFTVSGGGVVRANVFEAPNVRTPATFGIIGATQGALAYQQITVVPPPSRNEPLIAVAAYDDGIVLHDARTFAVRGILAIGGPPGDVAFAARGDFYAPDTDGTSLTRVLREPWALANANDVPLGNEVAYDSVGDAALVTNRDVGGMGALTRVDARGVTSRVITGVTAEGIALDRGRRIAYVSNVNDASIAAVDVRTMNVLEKYHGVDRAFGEALDESHHRLYVVANISPEMHEGRGYLRAFDVAGGLRAAQRSAGMPFPLGVAVDGARGKVFVTDEAADRVFVYDARTLKRARAPLATCSTPWRPRIFHDRLYVPCTRANAVDVFDLRTLVRVRGAPFATGGFPLSVAVWP